mgnify:CR=1 FL=1
MALQKVGPYEVDPKEPWKNDKLDRKRVADYLTPVIASVSQPFTISLHSPYGTGKTSFVLSWQADLRSQGYKTVYFNAWETDFSQDAFLAFMSAIRTQLSDQSSAPKKARKGISKVARKGIWSAFKRGAPKLVKGAVKRIAGEETVEGALELAGLAADEVASASEEWVAAALEAQEAQENSRVQFKVELQEFVKSELRGANEQSKKKLIVFVDDLDRCRPNYAIQLLEAIKHLFDVDGLLFVLSIDEAQIRESVRAVYGHQANAEGYLAKFIDWRYRLPTPRRDKYIDFVLEKYALHTIKVYRNNDMQSFAAMAHALRTGAVVFGWTLRECNAAIANLNLVCRAVKSDEVFFARAIGMTAILLHQFPAEFEAALRERNSGELEKEIAKYPGAISQLRFGAWHKFRDELELLFSILSKEYFNNKYRTYSDVLEETQAIPSDVRRKEIIRTQKLLELHTEIENLVSNIRDLYAGISIADLAYADIRGAAAIVGN